jgi:hypothetical protein
MVAGSEQGLDDQALERWSVLNSTLEAEPSQVVERIGRIALQLGR